MADDQIHDEAPHPHRAADIRARARWRRFNRVMLAVLLGCIVFAYTLGALNMRVIPEDENDVLPMPVEALVLALAFTVGSLPVPWSIIGRVIIPVPTFFLYLTVFLGKDPPLPFYVGFVISGLYSAVLMALSRHLADRPMRQLLGSRAHHG
jgi:hypothetical protein